MKFGDAVRLSKREANMGLAACLGYVVVLLTIVYVAVNYL